MSFSENKVPGRSYIERILGLSAGTVITKQTKEPNNRVPLGALLIGCIVSLVVRNVPHRKNKNFKVAHANFLMWGVHRAPTINFVCTRLDKQQIWQHAAIFVQFF